MTTDQSYSQQSEASTASHRAERGVEAAREGAQEVLDEARTQMRGLLDDVRVEVGRQSRSQRDRLVMALDSFGQDAERMAAQAPSTGVAGRLVGEAAFMARNWSQRLATREPEQLLAEVRKFARRRPTAFLTAAVVAGIAAGRLARGTAAETPPGSSGLARSTTADPWATSGQYGDPYVGDVHATEQDLTGSTHGFEGQAADQPLAADLGTDAGVALPRRSTP